MRRRRHNHQNDDKKRFYLLPGQGGKLYWKKQKIFLTWSLIAALVVSLALAAAMLWMNRAK